MSKLLLVLAVLCFAAMAQADTQIATGSYSDDSCTTQTFNVTVTAGTCSGGFGVYSAMYCSTDGAFVYVYSFTDASCNATYATGVAQFPTSCGWTAGKTKYTCINPSAGPAAPFSFPPSGFVQSVGCVNATDSYKPASVCSNPNSDPAIHCTQRASLLTCQKSPLPGTSSMNFGCTADGNSLALYYRDSACGTLAFARQTPAGCYNGAQTTCNYNIVSNLPNEGFTQYDTDNCQPSSTQPGTTTLFFDNTCANSHTFACSTVNGTQTGTYTTFLDKTGNGTCPTDASTTVVAQNVDKCINKQIFTCNFKPTPTPTGAASSTGSSMVAMVIAAIVALIASLSL